MSATNDLIGQKFGRLTVIKKADKNYISPKGYTKSRWVCLCDCGNIITVTGNDLTTGKTKSCGCFHKETSALNGKGNKKYNRYNLSGEYGIGYDCNGNEFYFDLEDYDKIKDYCWSIANDGYIKTTVHYKNENGKDKKRSVLMHRIIMNNPDKKLCIDHINGASTRNDNRKTNLRIVTYSQNLMNKGTISSNKSGITGIYWDKTNNKWIASITINKKHIALGRFNDFDEAVKARKKAEEKYFGEYAYRR